MHHNAGRSRKRNAVGGRHAGAVMTAPPESSIGQHDTVLIIEGVAQSDAAKPYAPTNVLVYGTPGLRSWATGGAPADLHVVENKRVVVALAADISKDLLTYEAAVTVTEAVLAEGATDVRYLMIPGRAALLDTALGSRAEDRRAPYLANLIKQAKPKLPRKPAKKSDRAESDEAAFFNIDGLLVNQLYREVIERHPAALTQERAVALYRNGVFHIDGTAFSGVIAELLGDRFRPAHRAAAEEFAAGMLFNAGLFLPEHSDVALLNVRNGMLDLATGTLKPHDPVYLSSTQLPVVWDPDATCPTYERWLAEAVDEQTDDLEEVASTMLNPAQTPTKAVFLFGPSRSGKSTFLRLMRTIAGNANCSAVTLHQLADNRFAAANVYGKILNSAADLSAAHVEDMSMFKMMTGEDAIQADRKFGGQFTFTNRALFAFSANELPTVGESSRAYVERIKPFGFLKSFAGREDPTIEATMIAAELPGILVRWVKAWQRMAARGGFLPTDARIRREFEVRSDRVRQFVDEQCVIQAVSPSGQAVSPGSELPDRLTMTQRAFAQAFNAWAEQQKASALGERKIKDRVTSINGVFEVRRMPASTRALNVTLRADAAEEWPQEPPETDLVPAVPAVSERIVPTSGKTCDLPDLGGGGQGVLSYTHGGKWAETAGTAGAQSGCTRCGRPLIALIDVTSGYHDDCNVTAAAA